MVIVFERLLCCVFCNYQQLSAAFCCSVHFIQAQLECQTKFGDFCIYLDWTDRSVCILPAIEEDTLCLSCMHKAMTQVMHDCHVSSC